MKQKSGVRITTMIGMGDNLYTASAVASWLRHNPDTAIEVHTPWPQFYPSDDRVYVRPLESCNIRHAASNISSEGFDPAFDGETTMSNRVAYRAKSTGDFQPIYRQLMECLNFMSSQGIPMDDYLLAWQGEEQKTWTPDTEAPYALFRPAMERKEWQCGNRNCHQASIQQAINEAGRIGFRTAVIYDEAPGIEWCVDFKPKADLEIVNCASNAELVQWVQRAALVVSPVGFMAPLCQAIGTPAVIVHGGFGKFNNPNVISAPAVSQLHHVLPTHYDATLSNRHADCDRDIDPVEIEKSVRNVASYFSDAKKREQLTQQANHRASIARRWVPEA